MGFFVLFFFKRYFHKDTQNCWKKENLANGGVLSKLNMSVENIIHVYYNMHWHFSKIVMNSIYVIEPHYWQITRWCNTTRFLIYQALYKVGLKTHLTLPCLCNVKASFFFFKTRYLKLNKFITSRVITIAWIYAGNRKIKCYFVCNITHISCYEYIRIKNSFT